MRDFLKNVLATVVGLFLFAALGLGGLIVLVAIAANLSKEEDTRVVENKSILLFDLSLTIRDAPPVTNPGRLLQDALSGSTIDPSLTLRDTLQAIRAAAQDEQIVGLYLRGDLGSGANNYATLLEVRQALQEFRKSGKPILAYDTAWTEQDYFLGSLASSVTVHPLGSVELNGFRAETPFFAAALQKYGIGVQTPRAGEFKAAVEPFTRNERSPADRQQTQKLLSDLWGEYVRQVAGDRKLTPQQLQQMADRQPELLANEAKAAGLVERLAYPDELLPDLRQLTGEEKDEETTSFRHVTLAEYIQQSDDEAADRNQIAVVYAEGNIVSGQGDVGEIGGDRLAQQIRTLRDDDDVKAIVLRVNTPGGGAIASDQVAREVKLTRGVKPIIASMGGLAASGGYQISAYANQIFASPTTITGSIGVFGLIPNVQQLANNNGITWDVVKTGQFADIETISRPKTPQELALIQRSVDQIYNNFLNTVADSRELPRQRVAEIAQGRVWSGLEAKRIGLVDELGGLDAAIQAAAKAAQLKQWTVRDYPRGRSLEGLLFRQLLEQESIAARHQAPFTEAWQHIQTELHSFNRMNDPLGVYTRLPFLIRID